MPQIRRLWVLAADSAPYALRRHQWGGCSFGIGRAFASRACSLSASSSISRVDCRSATSSPSWRRIICGSIPGDPFIAATSSTSTILVMARHHHGNPRRGACARGVVCEGPVGARWLGRSRIFRYEVRCWAGGRIPDIAEAVDSPVRTTEDPMSVQNALALLRAVPSLTWGRDELGAGEMWNSNSLVAWVLARSDHDMVGGCRGGGDCQPSGPRRGDRGRARIPHPAAPCAMPACVTASCSPCWSSMGVGFRSNTTLRTVPVNA